MIPILYEKSETQFKTNGIGRLDAVGCIVSERLNDFFTLELNISTDARYADQIEPGKIILATPADGERPQPFRIYEVDKDLTGTIDVLANHISYDLSGYPVRGISVSSASAAMTALTSRAIIAPGFTFDTDLTVSAAWAVPGACSIRAAMGGENGLQSVYGGEWYYDRYAVHLLAHRGADNGVTIRYGRNLTELDAIANDEERYTGTFAYYYSNGNYVGSNIQYLDQYAVPQKILIVDHTSDFQSTPTTAQLDTLAAADLAASGLKNSLSVSYVPSIEHVRLGDLVTVAYDRYGIRQKLEVVQTDYNVLLDRYDSIELGAVMPTLADTIASLAQ